MNVLNSKSHQYSQCSQNNPSTSSGTQNSKTPMGKKLYEQIYNTKENILLRNPQKIL